MFSLIGKKAPLFKAEAVLDGRSISTMHLEDFKGKHVVLFFYPLDFTFVCPTEIHAFQEKLEEFKKRNTILLACSVDSVYSHLAWLETPKEKGGIQGITYPIIGDLGGKIAREYGVLNDDGVAYRGLFLLDKNGVVRHQVVNDLPLGRNVDEVVRMIDALQHHEQYGEVCPANWNKDQKAMQATKESTSEYLANQ